MLRIQAVRGLLVVPIYSANRNIITSVSPDCRYLHLKRAEFCVTLFCPQVDLPLVVFPSLRPHNRTADNARSFQRIRLIDSLDFDAIRVVVDLCSGHISNKVHKPASLV